jgi:hypothetical protein
MPISPSRWKTINKSEFAWERAALHFIRERLPDEEAYRAWSNFDFVAEDGSINEVDLVVLCERGFYLIEIKSRSGVLYGDKPYVGLDPRGAAVHLRQPAPAREPQSEEARFPSRTPAGPQKDRPPLPRSACLLLGEWPQEQSRGAAAQGVYLSDRA